MKIIKSLRSEYIKIKGTSTVYLCFLMALVLPFFSLVDMLMGQTVNDKHPNQWIALFIEARQGLNIIALPMYIILACTLYPQIEHRNRAWKQLFASPQLTSNIYLAKLLIVLFLTLLFIILNAVIFIFVGVIANLYNPDLVFFTTEFDVFEIFIPYLRSFISILGIVTIQLWFGIRFQNFIVPLAAGMVMFLGAGLLVIELNASPEFFPHAYTLLVTFPEYDYVFPKIALFSVLFFIVGSILAYLDLRKNKFYTSE